MYELKKKWKGSYE